MKEINTVMEFGPYSSSSKEKRDAQGLGTGAVKKSLSTSISPVN